MTAIQAAVDKELPFIIKSKINSKLDVSEAGFCVSQNEHSGTALNVKQKQEREKAQVTQIFLLYLDNRRKRFLKYAHLTCSINC